MCTRLYFVLATILGICGHLSSGTRDENDVTQTRTLGHLDDDNLQERIASLSRHIVDHPPVTLVPQDDLKARSFPGGTGSSSSEVSSQSSPEVLLGATAFNTTSSTGSPSSTTVPPGVSTITSLLFAILLAITAILLIISGVFLMDLRRQYLNMSKPRYNKLNSEPI